MTKDQKDRSDAIAALCTKYLGDNDDSKSKAAAFADDEKHTLDTVKDALLAELHTKANAQPAEPPPKPQTGDLAAYLERRTQISALCVSALGESLETVKRVEAFLNDPLVTVESVRNAMFAEMSAKLKAPRPGDEPLNPTDKAAKRKAELEAEYDAHASTHAQLGVSKEDYVRNALEIGDGPVVIQPAK